MNEKARPGDKKQEVVILPRDPESGYVYWRIATPLKGSLVVELHRDGQIDERFEVDQAEGGRFVRFPVAGAVYRACVRSKQLAKPLESALVEAPRRAPGDDGAAFVKVGWTPAGLQVEPAGHHDEIHGSFPAGKPRRRPLSSTAFQR